MMKHRRTLSLMIAGVLLAVSCSSSSDGGNIELVEPSEPTPVAETTTDDATTSSSRVDGCDAAPPRVELWPGLDAVAPDAGVRVRAVTDELSGTNPFSCQTLVVVDPLIEPAAVGAVAAASMELSDPYMRIDLFVYESTDAAQAANPRDALPAALAAEMAADIGMQYSSGGPFLRFVTSWVDTDGTGDTPSENYFTTTDELQAVFDIVLHYEQSIFGNE